MAGNVNAVWLKIATVGVYKFVWIFTFLHFYSFVSCVLSAVAYLFFVLFFFRDKLGHVGH